MKKKLKIILIVLSALLCAILLDTVQAKIFDNEPIFKIVEDYNGGELYQKHKGILVDTYIFTDNSKKTVFKWEELGRNKENKEISDSLNTDITKDVVSIDNIDDVYNSEITNKYTDIRELSEDYTVKQAQQDNCFVIGAMVHNDNLYSEFMTNFNEKKSYFIRVVQTTVEGDLYIIDLLYDSISNKIHLVKDDTRDGFSAQEDRTIKYMTYEKTGVWNYQNSEYWVVYNGELPDETSAEYNINSDELFIIAVIN